MSLITEAFDSIGFEEAAPGEFTKRAFLNNKIDLNEAESVLDVIDSASADDVYLSSKSLSGEFSKKVHGFASAINDLRMRVEGEIDFSDEGESFMDEKIISDLDLLVCDFELFLGGCRNKKNMSVKNKVVFVGPVNSGKSSTFNRLLGFERALISDIPGTTRDIIESEVFYSNLSFSLFDTAGIRNTDDSIEAMGIDYAKSEIGNADVVVGVFDSPLDDSIDYFTSLVGDKSFIKVLNKIDLDNSEHGDFDCLISAKTGEGFDGFKKKIVSFFSEGSDESATFLVRDRHIVLFNESIESLKKSLSILRSGEGLEIAAEELKISRSCLDVVVGEKTSNDLLGDIFSNFCIGK
jgi:tRNA modification GTPase